MHVVSTNRREQMRLSGHPSTGAKKGTVHTLRNSVHDLDVGSVRAALRDQHGRNVALHYSLGA